MIHCDITTKHPVNVLRWQVDSVFCVMVTWGSVIAASVKASTLKEALQLAYDATTQWLEDGRRSIAEAHDVLDVALRKPAEEAAG